METVEKANEPFQRRFLPCLNYPKRMRLARSSSPPHSGKSILDARSSPSNHWLTSLKHTTRFRCFVLLLQLVWKGLRQCSDMALLKFVPSAFGKYIPAY